jgi:hypothetical protein
VAAGFLYLVAGSYRPEGKMILYDLGRTGPMRGPTPARDTWSTNLKALLSLFYPSRLRVRLHVLEGHLTPDVSNELAREVLGEGRRRPKKIGRGR